MAEITASLVKDLREKTGATEFLGYETESAEGNLLAILVDGKEVASLEGGQSGDLLILDFARRRHLEALMRPPHSLDHEASVGHRPGAAGRSRDRPCR